MVQLHCALVIVTKKNHNFFLFCHIFSPSQPSRHGQSITCGSPGRFGKLYLDQDRLRLCAQSLSYFLEHPHLCEAADQPGHYRQVWVLSLQPTTQVGSTDLHWWHQNKWWQIQDHLIPKNISIPRNPDQPRGNLEAILLRNKLCVFLQFFYEVELNFEVSNESTIIKSTNLDQ